jgi:hypothetical protein
MKSALNILQSVAWLFLASVPSEAQLENGRFETGDLTGWTIFNDTNGTTGGATVVLFDTSGNGTPSLCAQFQVGSTVGYVYGSLGSGGGISQSVNLNAGQLNITINIAAYNPGSRKNCDTGTFILILDGQQVATSIFGSIDGYQTNRSTLSYSKTVAAGPHVIAVDMRRNYYMGTGSSASPFQYLDDIVLSGSAVPGSVRLNIQPNGSSVVLTWTNPAYLLQAASSPAGTFTFISGASSPYTNSITGPSEYFRLTGD